MLHETCRYSQVFSPKCVVLYLGSNIAHSIQIKNKPEAYYQNNLTSLYASIINETEVCIWNGLTLEA